MFFGSKKDENAKDGAATGEAAAKEPNTAAAGDAQTSPQVGAQAAPQSGAEAATPSQSDQAISPADLDPEIQAKIAEVRAKLHETFGKVALAMMAVPRYRSLSLSDLSQFLLDPLMRDRVAIASSAKDGEPLEDTPSGIAIWASVSEEVDAKIREQIKAGTFPIRMKPDDWNSGSVNWLLDVIAPNQRLTTAVIANFRQIIKEGDMRIHPIVTRLVEPEMLEKMGAKPVTTADATPQATTSAVGNA